MLTKRNGIQRIRAETKKYRITDASGRELGESEGTTQEGALMKLYAMDPTAVRLSREQAERIIAAREALFEELA